MQTAEHFVISALIQHQDQPDQLSFPIHRWYDYFERLNPVERKVSNGLHDLPIFVTNSSRRLTKKVISFFS